MVSRDFACQLEGYGLTTASILYRMPDHRSLLQEFIWQDYDLAPRFPELNKFLSFWAANLVALPHFWWKGSSPRAVIPLEVNAFLGKPAACCHFAIGAARKIERRGTPKTLCFIGGFELHQKCGRANLE